MDDKLKIDIYMFIRKLSRDAGLDGQSPPSLVRRKAGSIWNKLIKEYPDVPKEEMQELLEEWNNA